MTDIGSDELTWDYNGQLTESTIASLEYNWSGKLRKAKIGQSDVISSIKYDPMGNRVYKEVPGDPCSVKRRYIVDIASRLPTILCVIDADDGSLERSYIYSGAQPIAFYEGSNDDPNYFYLHDRLGSVRQVLDSAGNVKNTYTYTPFGQDPNSQFAETVDNPFRFTGQWYDSEIGQYHLRARMYEPYLMRFTSIDPFFGRPFNPLTLHRYIYCLSDPLNRVDPDGENSMAAALVAPVVAGYGTHAIAITITAYAVSQMDFDLMALGIALEQGIGDVMALTAIGMTPGAALTYAARHNFPRDYPYRDRNCLERIIDEHDQGMQGDPKFRNQKDPNDWWKRMLQNVLEFFESLKG